MTKLMKYLKPYIGWILVITALLCGQALFELELPGQMQDIVNNGIQNGGVSDGVFEQISQDHLETLLLFGSDTQKEDILADYDLVTPDAATQEQLNSIPNLKDENVFIKKDLDSAEDEALHDNLAMVEIQVIQLMQNMNTTIEKIEEDVKAQIAAGQAPSGQMQALISGLESYQTDTGTESDESTDLTSMDIAGILDQVNPQLITLLMQYTDMD